MKLILKVFLYYFALCDSYVLTTPKSSIFITFSFIVLVLGNMKIAKATTFVEDLDAGELPVNAMKVDADTTLIKGNFFNAGGDNDLYQLQFEQGGLLKIQSHLVGLDANLVEHAYGSFPLFLFDHLAHSLKQGDGETYYSIVAGETYYLGMGGVPLDTNGNQLFDLSISEPIMNDAIFANWNNGQYHLQVVLPYNISLNLTSSALPIRPLSVPEPGIVIGLGFLALSSIFQKVLSNKKVIH